MFLIRNSPLLLIKPQTKSTLLKNKIQTSPNDRFGIMEIVTSGSYIIKRNPYDLPEGFLMQSAYIYILCIGKRRMELELRFAPVIKVGSKSGESPIGTFDKRCLSFSAGQAE